MIARQFEFAILFALIAKTIAYPADYPSDKTIQRLQIRADHISETVGRTISGIVVSKVTHLARLDAKNPTNQELNCVLTFDHAEMINESQNVVDFQFQRSVEGDAAHLKISSSPATNGKLFVVVFNVQGVGKFTHRHARTIGDTPLRPIGKTSGTTGGHIPMHGINPTDKSVTYSLLPETDDPWLFGSCDIYALE